MADPNSGVTGWGARPQADDGANYAGQGPTGHTVMLDRSGRRVPVPNDQVDQAFRSGQLTFSRGVQVPVINDRGELENQPSEVVARWLQQPNAPLRRIALGTEFERQVQTRDQAAREEHYGSAGGMLTTAVQNLVTEVVPWEEANGARQTAAENERRLRVARETGGVYVPADNALEEGRRANPVTAFLGRAAPWAALAVATDGIGLTGGGLLGGAEGTIARSVGAQASRTAAATLERAGLEATRAARFGSVVGRTATTLTENAAFGALASERERIAADRPFAGEAFARDVGLSALMGLGVEGGFAGLAAGARGLSSFAARRTQRAAEDAAIINSAANSVGPPSAYIPTPGQTRQAEFSALATSAAPGQADNAAQLFDRRMHTMANIPEVEINRQMTRLADMGPTTHRQLEEALYSRVPQIIERASGNTLEAAPAIARELNGLAEIVPKSALRAEENAGFRGELERVARAFTEDFIGHPATGSIGKNGVIKWAEAIPPRVPDAPLSRIMDDLHSLKQKISEHAESYRGADDSVLPSVKRVSDQVQGTINGILGNPAYFGEAAPQYAQWARSTASALTGLDNISASMGKKLKSTRWENGVPVADYAPNPTAVEQMTRSFDDLKSKTARDQMDINFRDVEQGLDGLTADGLLSAEERQALGAQIHDYRSQRDFLTGHHGAKSFINKVLAAEGNRNGLAALAGIGPGTAGIIGGMAGGLPGALVGMISGLAINSAFKLGQRLTILDKLERSSHSFFRRVDGSLTRIENILNGRIKYAPRVGEMVPLIWSENLSEKKKDQLYLTMTENIQRLTDPSELLNTLTQTMPHTPQIEPMTQRLAGTAYRGVQYLNGLIPPTPSGPLSSENERMPSATQRDTFLHAMAGVDDPTLLVAGLAHGNIPTATVSAIRSVHPDFYAYIQGRINDLLSGSRNRENYAFRIQLSRVMGIPTDTSLQPAMMQALQSRYAQTTQQAQAQGMMRAPARKINTFSNTYSESQRIESRQ